MEKQEWHHLSLLRGWASEEFVSCSPPSVGAPVLLPALPPASLVVSIVVELTGTQDPADLGKLTHY